MAKKLLIGAAVLVLLAGAAFWWFIVREDEPEELGVDTTTGDEETSGTRPESFDGTWTVASDSDSQAGFRIEEEFAAGAVSHTAVGRSSEVEGSITVAGTEVSAGQFTVDLTALEFVDDPPTGSGDRRVGAMESQGLETNEFPEASFALSQPIDFGEIPSDNSTVTHEVTGDLTLHGVTKEVTFEVEAKLEGDTIRVASADPVPVVLADYDIDEPSAPFIAGVSGDGEFEFLLVLQQS